MSIEPALQLPSTRSFLETVLPRVATCVAHDLNNHLATLLGRSELALIRDDPARFRTALTEVVEAGQPARVLVADLQRLIAWTHSPEGQVAPADVIHLAARLCGRRCEQMQVHLTLLAAAGPVRVERPAEITLLVWTVLQRALVNAPAEGAAWTVEVLGRSEEWSVGFELPGVGWTDEDWREFDRAQRSGGTLDGELGDLLTGLRQLGARFEAGEGRALARF